MRFVVLATRLARCAVSAWFATRPTKCLNRAPINQRPLHMRCSTRVLSERHHGLHCNYWPTPMDHGRPCNNPKQDTESSYGAVFVLGRVDEQRDGNAYLAGGRDDARAGGGGDAAGDGALLVPPQPPRLRLRCSRRVRRRCHFRRFSLRHGGALPVKTRSP